MGNSYPGTPMNVVSKLDFYDILGVTPLASAEEIRIAHRSLARQYHPDTAEDGVGNPEIFAQIQQAYEVLSSRDHRRRYDVKLAMSRGETPPGQKRRPPRSPCNVCGTPIYASQLTNYLGRYMCKDCLERMGRRSGKPLELTRAAELRWKGRRLLFFLHAHLGLVIVVAIAALLAIARIGWMATHHRHAASRPVPHKVQAPAPVPALDDGNPCVLPKAASASVSE